MQELKRDPALKELELWISGGRTGDDRPFLRRLRGKIRRAGMEKDVRFFEDFGKTARQRFLQGLTLLSVPSTRATALFGSESFCT